MVNREIDKRTLIVFLDAVTNSEARLRDYHRHIQESGQELPDVFRRQYAGVRRIREILLRMSEAARSTNRLSLSEDDANLLASCIADALPELDMRLAGRISDEEERNWLVEQRELLLTEARALLTEPLHAILSIDAMSRVTPSVRSLQSRIPNGVTMPIGQIRVSNAEMDREAADAQRAQGRGSSYGHPGDREAHGFPGHDPRSGYAGPGQFPQHGYPAPGYPQPGGYAQPGYGAPPGHGGGGHGGGGYGGPGYGGPGYGPPSMPSHPPHGPGHVPGPYAPAGYPSPGYPDYGGHQNPGPNMPSYGGPPGAYAPADARLSGLQVQRNPFQANEGSYRGEGFSASSALAPEPRVPSQEGRGVAPVGLFDPNIVRDHRVRAQIRLDLQDLARAEQNDDLRLSLVHLGSLLEGLLLDHGLRHRKELTLGESPDIWDFHALAIQVLGAGLTAEQEPVLGILHACRRLLRPSCQIMHPIIVTAKMVVDAKAFLEWALARLGFVQGTGSGEAPGVGASTAALWRATKRGT